MTLRTEPPFDSKPCPMCSQEVRGIMALVHNFLVRWPEQRAMVKLYDLVEHRSGMFVLEVPNPIVEKALDATKALLAACHDMKRDGPNITWTAGTVLRIGELIPRLHKALFDLQPITDAHFDDNRHSHGKENILREQQGSVCIEFLPKYDYHYTVEVVKHGADIMHQECATGLKLHDQFKERMVRDPKFYGQIWCPTCRKNSPFKEFTSFGKVE